MSTSTSSWCAIVACCSTADRISLRRRRITASTARSTWRTHQRSSAASAASSADRLRTKSSLPPSPLISTRLTLALLALPLRNLQSPPCLSSARVTCRSQCRCRRSCRHARAPSSQSRPRFRTHPPISLRHVLGARTAMPDSRKLAATVVALATVAVAVVRHQPRQSLVLPVRKSTRNASGRLDACWCETPTRRLTLNVSFTDR